MSARIVRIELRRSSAIWTTLTLIVLGAAMLYATTRGWGSRWTQLATWQREYLFVLCPVALGAGAWQARRESRSKTGELFATTARPRWSRVVPTAAAMAIAVAAGYLGMFLAGAVQVAPTAPYFPPGTVPIVAVGMLALVGMVWLGLAIGSLLPSAFTPPAVVVAGLLAMLGLPIAVDQLSKGDGLPTALFLSPVLFRPDDDFVTFAGRLHAAQAGWLAAVALAGLVLFAAARWQTRAAAVVALVLGAGLTLVALPPTEAETTVPDLAARRLVCTDDAPRVCVATVHADALDDLREPGREALAILAAKLPQPPTSVAESPTSWLDENSRPQPAQTLLVNLDVEANGHSATTGDDLLWELLDGAGTRRCANTANDYLVPRLVVAGWLLDKKPAPGPWDSGETGKAWDAFRRLPPAEQRDRVAALRAASLRCERTDLMTLLIGRSTP